MTYEEMIDHMTISDDARIAIRLTELIQEVSGCESCRMNLGQVFERHEYYEESYSRVKMRHDYFLRKVAFAKEIFKGHPNGK